MSKNPYIPIYYNDLRGSTIDWNDEEFGAYVRLLIYQWDKGFIPLEMSRLNKIADSAEKNWTVLCKKFTPDEKGSLQNSVMEKLRQKRDKFIEHQRANGLNGGRPPGDRKNPKKTQLKTQLKAKKKPLENENENENEFENENEIVMPFTSENFQVLWQNWKKYRLQEFSSKYKSAQSEQAALSHLANISGGIEDVAREVIMQSIARQWQGLFELKPNANGTNQNKPGTGKITGEQLNQAYAKLHKKQ